MSRCAVTRQWRSFAGLLRCLGVGWAIFSSPGAGFAHGDLHDRVVALRAALAAAPDNAHLHFELAWVYCQHEEWPDALAAVERAEQLAPGVHPVDLVRGRAYVGLQRFAEARAALDGFLAAHPERADVLLDRARAWAGLGVTEASLADFRAMVQAVARPAPAAVLEAVEAFTAAGRRDEAAVLLAAATKKIGVFPELALKALEIDLALGRFDDAIRQTEILRDLAPRPESWMAERAGLLARAGRTSDARAAWDGLLAHLDALPNLERGMPAMQHLAAHARASRDELSDPAVTAASHPAASVPPS